MDLKDIQELIKFVAKSGATEVELEIDNVKISIKSPPKKRRGSADEAPLIINQEQSQIAPTGVIPIQSIQQNIIPVETPSSAISTEIKESTDHLVTIKSSMIGTFYRSSSPEKPAFVNVGDEKVMLNIEKYGNTTTATIPLCLWDWETKLKKGDNLVLAAFGGGFTWGSIYLKWAYDSKK